ncbi:MAG: GyrI-like domain-containing protein [Candidatus Heimdallarchaeota archaeon]
MTVKIDFKKSMKELYQPSAKEPVLIHVPEMQFIMIEGKGSPGDSQQYSDAIGTLYPIAYKLKFLSKGKSKDYVVPPLEGLWWADDMKDFIEGNRDKWKWTMMIMTPKWVTSRMYEEAKRFALAKKSELKESITKVRLEKYHEGKSAQIMHIGPYSEEHHTIMKLHNYIKEQGGNFDGYKHKHHEIYLSDPRKANPATMKTIIRQPFE